MLYGYFSFVLHSHLPYVLSHGRWPHGVDWLNEASAETYIPLLNIFYKLVQEGYSPKVNIGITPILAEQLNDETFKKEFIYYLENKINASIEDEKKFKKLEDENLSELAKFWRRYYEKIKQDFVEKYNYNLVSSFKKLQDEGHIEILTSCATHGYLPLLSEDTSVQAQIKVGVKNYEKHFGKKPKGIWLPECAYRPRYEWKNPVKERKPYLRKGIEEFLSEEKIDYFVIDSHLLKGGRAIGVYIDRFEALKRLWRQFEKEIKIRKEEKEKSPHFIYLISKDLEGKKPVAIFTRDEKTGLQVWSGEWGYPGDGWYLDFHKKHFPGGLKYWRVTSAKADLGDKEEYFPDKARQRIPEHSKHFKELVKGTLFENFKKTNKTGIVVSPYDAELFGHWWFEGVDWLYNVIKQISDDKEIKLCTCSEYLEENPPHSILSIPEGSWGEGGFHWIWLNPWTNWTWKYVYDAEEEVKNLSKKFYKSSDKIIQRILKQICREVLLLESSDWQFLISTWSARDYAEVRVLEHYNCFKKLKHILQNYLKNKKLSQGEKEFLKECEEKDNVFEELDPKWFAKLEFPV